MPVLSECCRDEQSGAGLSVKGSDCVQILISKQMGGQSHFLLVVDVHCLSPVQSLTLVQLPPQPCQPVFDPAFLMTLTGPARSWCLWAPPPHSLVLLECP